MDGFLFFDAKAVGATFGRLSTQMGGEASNLRPNAKNPITKRLSD